MNTLATLHHTAFRQPGDAAYGKRTLIIEVPNADVSAEWVAEAAFHATNAPGAEAREFKREGRCYSLSCGDIVEHHADLLMVVGVGFRPLTRGQFAVLLISQKAAHARGERWTMDFDGVRMLDILQAPATED